MQETLNKALIELNRVINKPPSRPIRLFFFETPMLCGYVQNKVKDLFDKNEIININSFFNSDTFNNNIKKIETLEKKYGTEHKRFQRRLCDMLDSYITNFIEQNRSRKILIINDNELFTYDFNPIHFLGSYIFDDSSIVVQKNVPLIWVTVGRRDEYNTNVYKYYKTSETAGRVLEAKNSNFISCIYDFKANY